MLRGPLSNAQQPWPWPLPQAPPPRLQQFYDCVLPGLIENGWCALERFALLLGHSSLPHPATHPCRSVRAQARCGVLMTLSFSSSARNPPDFTPWMQPPRPPPQTHTQSTHIHAQTPPPPTSTDSPPPPHLDEVEVDVLPGEVSHRQHRTHTDLSHLTLQATNTGSSSKTRHTQHTAQGRAAISPESKQQGGTRQEHALGWHPRTCQYLIPPTHGVSGLISPSLSVGQCELITSGAPALVLKLWSQPVRLLQTT